MVNQNAEDIFVEGETRYSGIVPDVNDESASEIQKSKKGDLIWRT